MMDPRRGDASMSQARVEPPIRPTSHSFGEALPASSRRLTRIAWKRRLVQAVGVVLLVRLGQLQLLEGRALFQMAEDNRTQIQFIAAPRGRILDRNGVELVTSRPVYNLLYESKQESHQLDVKALAEIAGLDAAKMSATLAANDEADNERPKLVAEDITEDQAARVQPRLTLFPGLSLEIEPRRTYPFGATAAHVLGTVGLISQEEWETLKNDPQKRYSVTDRIGKTGLEKALNEVLAGQPGSRGFEVDAQGRRIKPLDERDSQPGQDVVLNLDIRLQKLVEEAFGKWKGAVVAIDPRNGEVLAMHSNPGFNPALFADRSHAKQLEALLEDPEKPLMNRAIQSAYQPGSVFKIVSSLAGWKSGAITAGTTHLCTGSISMFKKTWHCWNEKGHGTVDAKRALVESCNVFFYETALQLSPEAFAEMGQKFGLGSPTGIELPEEAEGIMPSPEWKQSAVGEPWWEGESLSVVIGQGMLEVTPIQAANLIAMVATGVRFQPRLVRQGGVDEAGESGRKESVRLDVSSRSLSNVREALWSVVNEGGTGARASNPVFPVAGKTGTAQVTKLERSKGKGSKKLRDHNWFAAYAPYDAPELAIVVFIENGGEKGKQAKTEIAGRIVKEYLTKLHPDEAKARKKAAEAERKAKQELARREAEEKAAEEQRMTADAQATQLAIDSSLMSEDLPTPMPYEPLPDDLAAPTPDRKTREDLATKAANQAVLDSAAGVEGTRGTDEQSRQEFEEDVGVGLDEPLDEDTSLDEPAARESTPRTQGSEREEPAQRDQRSGVDEPARRDESGEESRGRRDQRSGADEPDESGEESGERRDQRSEVEPAPRKESGDESPLPDEGPGVDRTPRVNEGSGLDYEDEPAAAKTPPPPIDQLESSGRPRRRPTEARAEPQDQGSGLDEPEQAETDADSDATDSDAPEPTPAAGKSNPR